MPFNWKAIHETEDADTRLYRLIGEMHSKRARRDDLTGLRDFLIKEKPGSDTWQTLGESIHRSTQGAKIGFMIWATWTKSLPDNEIQEVRGNLEEIWDGFGDTAPRAPVIEPEDQTPTDVVEVEVEIEIEVEDSLDHTGPSNTAVIRFPRPTLLSYVPQGPYTIRFLGESFDNVDKDAIVDLLRRGLLLGAEVNDQGVWVPVPEHPAFAELSEVMLREVRRVLLDSSGDDRSAVTTSVV